MPQPNAMPSAGYCSGRRANSGDGLPGPARGPFPDDERLEPRQAVLAPGREAVAARAQPGVSQTVVDDAGRRVRGITGRLADTARMGTVMPSRPIAARTASERSADRCASSRTTSSGASSTNASVMLPRMVGDEGDVAWVRTLRACVVGPLSQCVLWFWLAAVGAREGVRPNPLPQFHPMVLSRRHRRPARRPWHGRPRPRLSARSAQPSHRGRSGDSRRRHWWCRST